MLARLWLGCLASKRWKNYHLQKRESDETEPTKWKHSRNGRWKKDVWVLVVWQTAFYNSHGTSGNWKSFNFSWSLLLLHLACDLLQHHKHSRNICSSHGFSAFTVIPYPGRTQECCTIPARETHHSRHHNQRHRSKLLRTVLKNHQQLVPVHVDHLPPKRQTSQCKPRAHVSQAISTCQDTPQRCDATRNAALDITGRKPCSVFSTREEKLVIEWRRVSSRYTLFTVKSFIHCCSGIGPNIIRARFPSFGSAPVP